MYEPFSIYPAIVRDISLLVPLETKVKEVLEVINLEGKELVRDVDLFDLFVGENIPEGMKSLAFHITYQAKDRTLSSEEVDSLHQKIVKALTQRGWKVR